MLYPHDIFKTKLTKTVSVSKAKFPLFTFFTTVVVIYTRVNVGMYVLGHKYFTMALNVLTMLVYFFAVLTLFRKYVIQEKDKIRSQMQQGSKRELKRFSKIELRDDESALYHFGRESIYLPELSGFRTTYIKMTNLSYSDKDITEGMLEDMHNFCIKRNLLLTKYDMPKDIDTFDSIKYMNAAINNADHLTDMQISRASLRNDFIRELCKENTVVEDVYQITALDMNNNLAFPQHIKSLLNMCRSKGVSMDISPLTLDEVKKFFRDFFAIQIIDLHKMSDKQVSKEVLDSVLLHKVITAGGETYEFTPIMMSVPYGTTQYNMTQQSHFIKED